MNKTAVFLILIIVLGTFGHGLAEPSEKKVAVVALSVNDWSSSLLTSGGNPETSKMINEKMLGMLKTTEEMLGKYWTVVKTEEFIGLEEFRSLSIGQVKDGLYAPAINEQQLPSFTENRKEIIKSILSQETAKSLCQVLGVDAVAVIYSEWAVATGKWVPTNKALAKNCVSMYSSSGKRLFFVRKDIQGKQTLGAMGRIALNEGTIDEWTTAYETGLDFIIHSKKSVLK